MGETQVIETQGAGTHGITATFEACTEFRPGQDDPLVCSCGWLDDDHAVARLAILTPVRRPRPQITLPERRAS